MLSETEPPAESTLSSHAFVSGSNVWGFIWECAEPSIARNAAVAASAVRTSLELLMRTPV